jgi:hypothetical protein
MSNVKDQISKEIQSSNDKEKREKNRIREHGSTCLIIQLLVFPA